MRHSNTLGTISLLLVATTLLVLGFVGNRFKFNSEFNFNGEFNKASAQQPIENIRYDKDSQNTTSETTASSDTTSNNNKADLDTDKSDSVESHPANQISIPWFAAQLNNIAKDTATEPTITTTPVLLDTE